MISVPEVVSIDVGGGLVRKSLARQVYEALERAVISAQVPPGTRLGEDAVAAAFAVSRSPAREAIVELERVGLAERLPNRDRRVTVPTQAFIGDVYDVWTLMESERLWQSASVAAPGTIAQLRQLLRELEQLPSKQRDRRERTLTAFHTILQEGCANAQLHRAANDWYKYIQWFRNLYVDYHAEGGAGSMQEHREIVRHFASKNRDGLLDVLKRHLHSHRDRVLEAWRDSPTSILANSTRTMEFTLKAHVAEAR